MPSWLQYILWIAAGITAILAIWKQLLHPLAKLIKYLQEVLPLLSELTIQFKDTPSSLNILKVIAAEFKPDSGDSLRDIVNKLLLASTEAKEAARDIRIKAAVLEENVEAVKELSRKDRADAAHRLLVIDEILTKIKEKALPQQTD